MKYFSGIKQPSSLFDLRNFLPFPNVVLVPSYIVYEESRPSYLVSQESGRPRDNMCCCYQRQITGLYNAKASRRSPTDTRLAFPDIAWRAVDVAVVSSTLLNTQAIGSPCCINTEHTTLGSSGAWTTSGSGSDPISTLIKHTSTSTPPHNVKYLTCRRERQSAERECSPTDEWPPSRLYLRNGPNYATKAHSNIVSLIFAAVRQPGAERHLLVSPSP
ncbi:hypothetical protein J6590_024496 [Homalodisca vitripennis]|nr:hypothetical protein J6590_024496 [Homalodisca vitripennis]